MDDVVDLHPTGTEEEQRRFAEMQDLRACAAAQKPYVDYLVRVEYNRRRRMGAPAYQAQPFSGAPLKLKRICRRHIMENFEVLLDMQNAMHRTDTSDSWYVPPVRGVDQ